MYSGLTKPIKTMFFMFVLLAMFFSAGCIKTFKIVGGNNADSPGVAGADSAANVADTNTATPTATMTATEVETEDPEPSKTFTPTATFTQIPTDTPEPSPTPVKLGPELDDVPEGYNPLNGLPVSNPDLLKLPAVLMSITDWPPSSRPQSGLSFAPHIYEIYIGEGMTRFLTVFYGEVPRNQDQYVGDQPVREDPFIQEGLMVGDRVWMDKNGNAVQDDDEVGIAGIGVGLIDAETGQVIEDTTTNSYGLFGFNVEEGKSYRLHFILPDIYNFVLQDQGNEDIDSDVNPADGLTEIFIVEGNDLDWDAGMVYVPGAYEPELEKEDDLVTIGDFVWQDLNYNGLQDDNEFGISGVTVKLVDKDLNVLQTATTNFAGYYGFNVSLDKEYRIKVFAPTNYSYTTPFIGDDRNVDSDVDGNGYSVPFEVLNDDFSLDAGLIPPPPNPVGPGRSGRQAYTPFVTSFGPGTCLVAASKDPTVKVTLCKYIYGSDTSDINSAGIQPDDIPKIAEDNKIWDKDPNYSGNVYDENPVEGGTAATQIHAFWSYLNQSVFKYDSMLDAYMRFDDRAADGAGNFVPSTDRYTGQQLSFGNVVILYVDHVVERQFVYDLNMTGERGWATVFRNGQMYEDLTWTTIGDEFEKTTGIARPIKIRYKDGTPFPMNTGNTWYLVATVGSDLTEVAPGSWKYRYYPPAGVE